MNKTIMTCDNFWTYLGFRDVGQTSQKSSRSGSRSEPKIDVDHFAVLSRCST